MTIKQIYELAIELGKNSDMRGSKIVDKYLDRQKEKYQKLDGEAKLEFDTDKLFNPYSDTRILIDNNKKIIKKILVGIDIAGAELLLADKMKDIDLVISHHPDGPALADLYSVMDMQVHLLAQKGIPINIAEGIMKPRIARVGRGLLAENHNRNLDMARILGLDYMCTHTIADNLALKLVSDLFDKEAKKLETVEDIVNLLKTIPEYKEYSRRKAGPTVILGAPDNHCGKIVFGFTGGTSGSKDIYEKMSQYGIGTIIDMHMSEEHRTEAEKYHINVVIAGHYASDSLGMNLFLDELEKKGIEVVPISGLFRFKRFKN